MDNLPEDMVVVEEWRSPDGRFVFPSISVKDFNTQAADQCNSRLKGIRTQAAYVRQENYMRYVRFFLHQHSTRTMPKKYRVRQ